MITLVLTTAPSAYDYEYTRELANGLTVQQYDGQRTPPSNVRLVEIPTERVEYQTGRYLSGMYFTTTSADLIQVAVVDADERNQ